ncbi:PREDICTED: uncharacterized protein LOC106324710 isoform X3 [Brassica oleracea var. oleracea]|uniref:Calcineurin-like phosphoesterase domain-containing protein n=1 Tax=Brassica oleracea var. oleracea TaxID=109376 RepID=A0A0D3AL98_BRAOL|nr:PREDICTED: uncharacterized protein LOC106324710 isoform X3 [Brassica oleracea var. oleracea]
MASSSLVRIAVVGDVHGFWKLDEDQKALQLLQPQLVLFTGDFGEEDVPLVQSVAALPFPKAVILGNHDAWHTQKFPKKQNGVQMQLDMKENGVQMQLDILGDEHVGYQRMDFPSLKLSVVGGRPFSHGGDKLHRDKLLLKRYGVRNMNASAGTICRAALGTPEDHVVIVLAHNGPTGLGSQAEDICGRDWSAEGGDQGDPDLEQALRQLKETTELSVPLVVFGHMHKELGGGKGNRKMVVEDSDNKVLYVNGAIVPRVIEIKETPVGTAESESGGTVRAFTLVEILDGKIKKVVESWVQVTGSVAKIVEEMTLFEDVT